MMLTEEVPPEARARIFCTTLVPPQRIAELETSLAVLSQWAAAGTGGRLTSETFEACMRTGVLPDGVRVPLLWQVGWKVWTWIRASSPWHARDPLLVGAILFLFLAYAFLMLVLIACL